MKTSGEKYIFYYDDQSGETVRKVADSFAANPSLSFTSEDAGAIKERIREIFPKTTIL